LGSITITGLKKRDEDGTTTDVPFSNVNVTFDHVIVGATTLSCSQIYVAIYEDGNLPSGPIDKRRVRLPNNAAVANVGPELGLTVPPNIEAPLYSSSLLSQPTADNASQPWQTLIPKNTLQSSKNYTIIAQDVDEFVSVSQGLDTN
jgi:hypothetical protein